MANELIENEETETLETTEQQTLDAIVENKVEETTEQTQEVVDDKVQSETTEQEEELIILPDVEETKINEPVNTDLSEIFGESYKSKDEAKQYVESLKAENEKLKSQSENIFANDTVKALNDYMKNGGSEEKEFLDTKYNQSKIKQTIEAVKNVDPLAVIKEDLKVNHNLSDDEIEVYMSTENEVKLKIDGNKLKNDYIKQLESTLEQSEQQEATMIKNAQEKQFKFTERIKSYVGDLKEVGGVQVNDTHKKILLKDLQSPTDFIRKNFPLDKDGLPTNDWVVNAAKLATHTELVSVVKTRVKNAKAEGVKQAFSELHNIPNQEATAVKEVGQTEESVGQQILKNLKAKQSAPHYS